MAKPKNAFHSLLIKNAKKKKKSKTPYVNYPDTATVRKIIGLDK